MPKSRSTHDVAEAMARGGEVKSAGREEAEDRTEAAVLPRQVQPEGR